MLLPLLLKTCMLLLLSLAQWWDPGVLEWRVNASTTV
jgi:hypothetical protein